MSKEVALLYTMTKEVALIGRHPSTSRCFDADLLFSVSHIRAMLREYGGVPVVGGCGKEHVLVAAAGAVGAAAGAAAGARLADPGCAQGALGLYLYI